MPSNAETELRAPTDEEAELLQMAVDGGEESEDDLEEVPAHNAFFIVVVLPGEGGEKTVGTALVPEAAADFLKSLSDHITPEWLEDAPLGVYSFRYDFEAVIENAEELGIDEEDEGFEHFLFYSGPSGSNHGRQLGDLIAKDLVAAGAGLYNALAVAPEEGRLLDEYDRAINDTIAKVAKVNIRRYQPGCVGLVFAPESKKSLAFKQAQDNGALRIIYFQLPEPSFAFREYVEETVTRYVADVLKGREEIVVRARVRQLWRERGKVTTSKKMRKRIDEQIDHLCLVFGIDEETATQHTHWNLCIDPDDLEGVEQPPVNIPGLMPNIKAN